MAGDHGGKAGGDGIDHQMVDIVDHIEVVPGDADYLVDGQRLGPVAAVDIAAHRVDRCDLAQRRQHRRVAHIAGMDDQIAPRQRRQRIRAHLAVGIGDHADNGTLRRRSIHPSS